MHATRRWIAQSLGLALLVGAGLGSAGCSHAPKPAADAGAAPAPHAPAAHAAHKAPVPPAQGVVAGSSTAAAADTTQKAPVVPKLTPAQEKEMDLLSKNNVDAAQAALATLDPAKLDADKKQKYQIAKGMLDDAITARAQQDWMKAAQLSTKAKILAEELTSP